MKEIEVKVLGLDILDMKNKVINLGGNLVKNEHQENYFWSLKDTDTGYLRIRRINDLVNNREKITLCIKKIHTTEFARENIEHEFEVSSFDECMSFVKALGFNDFKREDKHRESYILNDVLIEFDTWDKNVFPYPYIELEAPNHEALRKIIDLLEIPQEKITSKGLLEIKKEMGLL